MVVIMGMVGDHTYSTTRTPYCSAAAEVSTQRHALEEEPELLVYLFCNLAPAWKANCVSLCSLDYALFCRKTKAQLSPSLKNRLPHFIVLTRQTLGRLSSFEICSDAASVRVDVKFVMANVRNEGIAF